MSDGDFFDDAARRAAADSVRAVEADTCAELVVAVRQRSGRYGVLAYHFGLGVAFVLVLYLLLTPVVYSPFAIALDAIAAFALGTLLAANADGVLRRLARPRTLQHNVETAARAAFYDLGISKTTGRTGILVFVSVFERRCCVLCDVGVEPRALEPGWSRVRAELELAVRERDLPRFNRGFRALGPVLRLAHPRRDDDVNELPDQLQ